MQLRVGAVGAEGTVKVTEMFCVGITAVPGNEAPLTVTIALYVPADRPVAEAENDMFEEFPALMEPDGGATVSQPLPLE